MSSDTFNWQTFLNRWQEEWVPRPDEDDEPLVPLCRPGADAAVIAAVEERLGQRLPPSYRDFLAVSDGWFVEQAAGIYQLGGTADIDWFGDPFGMTPLYEQGLGDDPREEEVLLAGMWRRALRLETDSDMSHALLDPGDTDEDGEWALYVYKGWSGEFPDRYPSFRAYMEAMYRGFHGDRAGSPEFVNATTRAQDARVDEAHALALRGRYEEALPLLQEALSFGRPRSGVLLNQLRHLSAPHDHQGHWLLTTDPLYLPEILPVEAAAEAARTARRPGHDDDHWVGMMAARGADRRTVEAVLSEVRAGTHRYAPGGPWGRAVAEARESAVWGATDAAWRALRDALPLWEAPGPLLIAPLGLLADPVLGPLITPERGRELLATPRAGGTGPAPDPVPDLDPPGLAWLAEPAAYQESFDAYRCVWVEGTDPARLPALIGEEGAGLSSPTDPHTVARRAPRPHERDGVELWEDRAVVAVGLAGDVWSFAFDGYSGHYLSDLFLSPGEAASCSGRAVVVWRDPRSSSQADRPAAFHLSVAEGGEELYAFTVRGAEIRRSGSIPEALDPARLFRPEDDEADSERRLLQALHTELGLSLPRFALTRGRLRTFTTRSWTRAPGPGEGFAYFRFERHRA
ncbi:SMI1/KNR4 family protein [Streptomyces narbonensis]|uniref:SMI1/KNR4 family protein n=1 Tax=Streptomyces narbonensis TaxID=67333 RepID=UPI00167552C1|nr:SMI1/KNR4 family protein [Streptomyces narbonensis]GGV98861.1 cell wall assembly protein [Streptomyces narbonensis]